MVDMDTEVVGGILLSHVVYGTAAFVVLYIVWEIVRRLFAKPAVDPHTQTARCTACGWEGQVSRYAGRCPMCNAQLGDGLSRR